MAFNEDSRRHDQRRKCVGQRDSAADEVEGGGHEVILGHLMLLDRIM